MIVQTYEERTVAGPAGSVVTDDVDWLTRARTRMSWGAVFAGVITTMVVQLLLTVLGMAIGFTATNAVTSQEAVRNIGVGAGLWWVISGIVSLFAGGWVAGRLAGVRRDVDAMLHGFMTWGLTTVISAFAVTTAMGTVVGGSLSDLQRGMLYNQKTDTPVAETDTPAPDDATNVATKDAGNLAAASWWTFLALVLGAGAATIGGRMGQPGMELDRTRPVRSTSTETPVGRL